MSSNVKLEKQGYRIMGLSVPVFMLVSLVVIAATYLEVLPKGMLGAFPLMIVMGELLGEAGDRTPIVKDFFGGGPIVIIFASAALASYNLLPESAINIITNFMKTESFLDFYIAALITGSILGMDRDLLIKAAVRYLPVIIGGIVAAFGLTAIVGAIMGYGAKEAVLYISLPIMGGGMGAGAVPLAEIYGKGLNVDPGSILSKMVPAVALGNAIAIVFAGILDKVGKNNSKISGNGKLMLNQADMEVEEQEQAPLKYENLGTGLLLSTTFFVFGAILGKYIPIHNYALMILTVAIVKATGIMPKRYETAAFQWFNFIMKNLTPTLLVGIGVAYTDLTEVIAALSPTYVILVSVTVLGSILGAGAVGRLFGFYPVEAAITGGLCMANMGGTGDVAVLSAANRMELMPFAQISSRIGGAFMLIVATSLVKLLI